MSYPMFLPFWIEPGPQVSLVEGGNVGEDIWLDVASPEGGDRIVTAAGDWRLVSGMEALRQSLKRRIVTEPGSWALEPDYGAGAQLYVKAKGTKATLDELSSRIRSQCLRDDRVLKVTAVYVDPSVENMIRLRVDVQARLSPLDATPVSIVLDVT